MHNPADDGLASRLSSVRSLIRAELAPFPGRMETTCRYVLACAIVIIIALALQVHFLAISLIVVFFTLQENTVLTRLSGMLMIVGTTIAIALSLLLIKYTIDYPLLRIGGACMLAFFGMYFMRISKYGSLGYVIALWVPYSQSILDTFDDPEVVTRLILWFLVAVTIPIFVALVVNYLFLPAHPGRLLKDEMVRQLDEVDAQIESKRTQTETPGLSLNAIERGILTLHKHLTFATLGEREFQRAKAFHLMRITTVDRLHTAAAQLAQLPACEPTQAQCDLMQRLQIACRDFKQSMVSDLKFSLTPGLVGDRLAHGELDIALYEMAYALQAAGEFDMAPPLAAPAEQQSAIVADALTNPVYGQFALKTVLATLLCYVFYTAVQWPGIHTAMLTCVIVAMPGLGATLHKGVLRIIGCVLGSIAALVATVFIIPHLDSITGLLLLMLPTFALGSWVAAGSNRTNYIGVQFVFAFALALLGRFGPTTDIVEIRDRLVGILFGLVVSLTISIALWPEREGTELRNLLARLLRGVAALARAGANAENDVVMRQQIDKARLQGWSLLTKNREMQARVALEPGWQYAHDSITVETQTWLVQAQEVLFAINWLQTLLQHGGAALPRPFLEAFEAFRINVAVRLDALANFFDGKPLDDNGFRSDAVSLDHLLAQAQAIGYASAHTEELITAVRTIDERIAQLSERIPLPAH